MAGYRPGHQRPRDASPQSPHGGQAGEHAGVRLHDPAWWGDAHPGDWQRDRWRAAGHLATGQQRPRRRGGERHRKDTTGGAEGNERLTALVGAVLLVLFAAEGVTIAAVHQLLTPHIFIGMVLVGPVVLKVASTAYRFVRYYCGAGEYVRKGPPAPLLRLLGPFVLALSLAVIGTGIVLGAVGPGGGIWLALHKGTFVLWFGAMTIHVLVYVWRLPGLIRGDLAVRVNHGMAVLGGRPARWLLVAGSLVAGLLLAVLTSHWAAAWAGFVSG